LRGISPRVAKLGRNAPAMLRARNFVSTGETRSRKCPRSRCAQQCPSAVSAIDVAHALCRSFARASMAASPHCARGHSRARRSACRRCPRATHRHSDGCVKPRADTARHGPRGSAWSEKPRHHAALRDEVALARRVPSGRGADARRGRPARGEGDERARNLGKGRGLKMLAGLPLRFSSPGSSPAMGRG